MKKVSSQMLKVILMGLLLITAACGEEPNTVENAIEEYYENLDDTENAPEAEENNDNNDGGFIDESENTGYGVGSEGGCTYVNFGEESYASDGC